MIDLWSLVGVIIFGIGVGIILYFVVPTTYINTRRPRDGLTDLRNRIFFLAISVVVTAFIPVINRIFRTFGVNIELLRNVSTILSAISFTIFAVLMALVINYKRKE